jgi:hypothetical protein
MPGYQEPSIHPAAYPDPDADAYMNGDPSSWAEDPHPGPYPNSPPPPALPGQQGPEGHPATDPAHYFPKAASRQLRAAMQHKAAKCIRIAQSMLGRKASVSAIEDQALDLMNLSDRQIQAALARLANMPPTAGMDSTADFPVEADFPVAGMEPDANMTLTPGVTADDLMLDDSMSDDAILAQMLAAEAPDSETADDVILAQMLAEEQQAPTAGFPMAGVDPTMANHHMAARRRSAKKSEEQVKANEVETAEEEAKAEGEAASKAAYFKRLAAFWSKKAGADSPAPYDQMPGSQNAPEHYNFRSEGVLASKAAKKSEEADETDAMLAEMEAEEAKAVGKKAKKAEEPAEDADAEDAEGKTANYLAGEDPLSDLMGEDGDDLSMADDLAAIYGMKNAKKAEEPSEDADAEKPAKEAKKADEDEGDEEEVEETEEEVEEEPAAKSAALRPQPRKASNGVRSLGAVAKVASSEINDLAKLWESAPDVSKIFG